MEKSNKSEETVDFKLFSEKFGIQDEKVFQKYLKEVWIDLACRSSDNGKPTGISKITFTSYFSLPGIIFDRLFSVLDANNSSLIEYQEFVDGMMHLFGGNYDNTCEIIFKIYDFDSDGKISKEDVRTILSYIKLTKENFFFQDRVRSQEEIFDIIEECFNYKRCDKIGLESFKSVIEKCNSDILLLILLFLYENKPFSSETFKNYSKDKTEIISPRKHNSKIIASPSKRTSFSPYKVFISPEEKRKSLGGFKKPVKKQSEKLKGFDIINLLQTPDFEDEQRPVTERGTESPKKNTPKRSPRKTPKKSPKKSPQKDEEKPTIHRKVKQNFKTMKKSVKEDHVDIKILPAFPETSQTKVDDSDSENEINDDFGFDNSDEEENEKEQSTAISDVKQEGYLYKFIDEKLKKIWFRLVGKDFFFLRNEKDEEHKGMHNLSGVFIIDEKKKIVIGGKTFFKFGMKYPKKTREYLVDNETDYIKWVDSLKKATGYINLADMYDVKDKIGNGRFGLIKLGINKETGEKVAIKIMEKKNMNPIDLDLVRTEIEILKICQHPNIIRLYDVLENVDFFYIVMEYCAGGDLFSYLEKRKFILPEAQACRFMNKMCAAVYYIHSFSVVHRDLKPENILMTSEDDDADLRILDFGLGKILAPNERSIEPYGTLSYAAPEILIDKPYGKEVDLFSLGVITYLMVGGSLPFDHKTSESEIARKTVYEEPPYKGSIWKKISNECKDFIGRLLLKDPHKRMKIEDALVHPWMKKYCGSIVKKRSEDIGKDDFGKFQLYSAANLTDLME